MRIIYRVPPVLLKRCVPYLITLNWFFNRRP